MFFALASSFLAHVCHGYLGVCLAPQVFGFNIRSFKLSLLGRARARPALVDSQHSTAQRICGNRTAGGGPDPSTMASSSRVAPKSWGHTPFNKMGTVFHVHCRCGSWRVAPGVLARLYWMGARTGELPSRHHVSSLIALRHSEVYAAPIRVKSECFPIRFASLTGDWLSPMLPRYEYS